MLKMQEKDLKKILFINRTSLKRPTLEYLVGLAFLTLHTSYFSRLLKGGNIWVLR